MMKMNKIREMTDPELVRLMEDLQREKLNLKIQAGTGQLQNPARITQIRKELARIKTEQTIRTRKQQASA